MKTIIAGSRTATDYNDLLCAVANCPFMVSSVVSGTARGADRLGERYAREHGLELHHYPADWDKHGKAAGYIRNAEMAKNAEALILLWDGESRGSKHMLDLAEKEGLEIFVKTIKE